MMNTELKDLRIAVVAEELTQLGGAERILDAIMELFPNAPIFTLVWDKEKTLHRYDKFDVRPSFIQKMPFGIKKYKWYLVLMPKAVESINLSNFDVVISITSALVKGVKTKPEQLHICYCNTPTRYLWTDSKEYVKNAPIPRFVRPFMPFIISILKKWDFKASKRPTYFIANSFNVQKRINDIYHRDSDIIYPFVDASHFNNKINKKSNYFLLVSRIEPYKKIDLVINAFKNLDENLVIVGSGTKIDEMKKNAPKNVKFLGRLNDDELVSTYAQAKALIFPQEEDFGITPIEAMAAGTPVIAYNRGGAKETVIPGITGEYFNAQTTESLKKTIKNFKPQKYSYKNLTSQAQKFDKAIFKAKIEEYINSKL